MFVRLERDYNRYVVYGRSAGAGEERIGFVARDGRGWNAVDTTMEHSRNFWTRADAVDWLERLAAADAGDGGARA